MTKTREIKFSRILHSIYMKYFLFFIFFLLIFCNVIFSQESFFGEIKYDIKTYANKEEMVTAKLFFTDSSSLFIYNKIGYDSVQKGKSIHSSFEPSKGITMYSSDVSETGEMIFRDLKKQHLILKETVSFLDDYLILDYWLPIDWHIFEEQKNILGFKAQKAIGQFRGRKYVVWYTEEIPFPFGPGKLFDLPGMILEAHDTTVDRTGKNTIIFKVKDICYPCQIQDEYEKLDVSESIPIEEYVFIRDHSRELIAIKFNRATKQKIKESFVKNGTPSTKGVIKRIRKNSMETIYEWERFPGDTPNPFDSEFKKLMREINDTTNLPITENRFPKRIKTLED